MTVVGRGVTVKNKEPGGRIYCPLLKTLGLVAAPVALAGGGLHLEKH